MTQFQPKWPETSRSKLQTMAAPNRLQTGFTLIELMVAMVIGLLITLAAIATLTVSRQGFNTVDAASQLRDNGRFAANLIQRLGVQSGFKDVDYAAGLFFEVNPEPAPSITGFNNRFLNSGAPLTQGDARTTADGSDVLILRNQLVKLNPNSNDADGSIIDCMGLAPTTGAAPGKNDRIESVLSVQDSKGEPSLMCTTINKITNAVSTQPIIQGVENFQVLYGTEGVTANTAPPVTYTRTAGAPAPTTSAAWETWANSLDQAPDTYLRADQMTVASDPISTNANWRRVRSLRIGMILRGAPNSAQSRGTQPPLYPFGLAKSSSAGAEGSALSSANDTGTEFTAPADGRLRQVVTFTVHLRNSQGL